MDTVTVACKSCGIAANVLTCLREYGNPPHKLCFDVSTFSKGFCECCGRETEVTQVRDYFNPDFSLLSRDNKMVLHNFLLEL